MERRQQIRDGETEEKDDEAGKKSGGKIVKGADSVWSETDTVRER